MIFKASIGAMVLGLCSALALEIAYASQAPAEAPVLQKWVAAHAGQPVDLTDYTLTFDDEFDTFDCVDWSGRPAGAHRWYAYGSVGYGSAVGCQSPIAASAYSVENGALALTVAKVGARWRMGEIASSSLSGEGFVQQYGYFVARIKLPAHVPAGLKVWPAFWLQGKVTPKPAHAFAELDVLENFGTDLRRNTSTLHLWPAAQPAAGEVRTHQQTQVAYPSSLYDDQWHTYGLRWTPTWFIIDVDGREVARIAVQGNEMRAPMQMVLDLALNGDPGAAVGTYTMSVDYVRAYVCRQPTGC